MGEVTAGVIGFVEAARAGSLDDSKLLACKMRVLDGLIAMISGRYLPAGIRGLDLAARQQAVGPVSVVGSDVATSLQAGVFANAMAAHADETDDVNNLARFHPGACVVPAALGMAELQDAKGIDLLRAVTVGYDVGCSVNMTAWTSLSAMQAEVRSPHGLGGTFAAAAAAMTLAELSYEQAAAALSFAAQQASGILTFYRDSDHVGKAFATAAMQATAGVRATEMAMYGFTDIDDALDGDPNLFDAIGDRHDSAHLLVELDRADHVRSTDIKLYPVGMPIQAAAEAMELILAAHQFSHSDIEAIECRLPPHSSRVVNRRLMPEINVQYILARLAVDRRLTFNSAHDRSGPSKGDVADLMERTTLVPDPSLVPAEDVDPRQRRTRIADLTVRLRDGNELHQRVEAPLGSRLRPPTWDDMHRKARMVLSDFRPEAKIDELVSAVYELDSVRVADLKRLLTEPTA